MHANIIHQKTYSFAIRIIKLRKYLIEKHKEFGLSEQILRSGTSIGAQVQESEHAQSKADFINKMSIALKEANETRYWLSLLNDTNYIEDAIFQSMHSDIDEIIKILASIVKTSKAGLKKK